LQTQKRANAADQSLGCTFGEIPPASGVLGEQACFYNHYEIDLLLSGDSSMNYDEYVRECVMRLAAAINPENGRPAFSPDGCLSRAIALAEVLVKQGFIGASYKLLQKKWEMHAAALGKAYRARRQEQIRQFGKLPPIDPETKERLTERLYDNDPKICKAARDALEQRAEQLGLALSSDVLTTMERFIDAKNEFYAITKLQMSELIEQARNYQAKKCGEGASIALDAEAFFDLISGFLDFAIFEDERNEEVLDQEQELLDNLERHMHSDYNAKRIYDALIASRKVERRFIDGVKSVWKTRLTKKPFTDVTELLAEED
jgi:hypothetical protein